MVLGRLAASTVLWQRTAYQIPKLWEAERLPRVQQALRQLNSLRCRHAVEVDGHEHCANLLVRDLVRDNALEEEEEEEERRKPRSDGGAGQGSGCTVQSVQRERGGRVVYVCA